MSKTSVSPARRLAITGIMAAASTLLMFLDFPLPLLPSFLKFDFSELPALIAAFCLGPIDGAIVCLMKNLINLSTSMTGGVGEFANFLIGIGLVVPAGIIYKRIPTRRGALTGCIAGTAIMAAISFPLNLWLVYPIYTKIIPIEVIIGMYSKILPGNDSLVTCILAVNVPFTLLKGILDSLITFFIYKRLSVILKGTRKI